MALEENKRSRTKNVMLDHLTEHQVDITITEVTQLKWLKKYINVKMLITSKGKHMCFRYVQNSSLQLFNIHLTYHAPSISS